MGYIAEEVNAIDQNLATKDKDNNPNGIDWNNIILFLVEEIKKLKTRIEILETK